MELDLAVGERQFLVVFEARQVVVEQVVRLRFASLRPLVFKFFKWQWLLSAFRVFFVIVHFHFLGLYGGVEDAYVCKRAAVDHDAELVRIDL